MVRSEFGVFAFWLFAFWEEDIKPKEIVCDWMPILMTLTKIFQGPRENLFSRLSSMTMNDER